MKIPIITCSPNRGGLTDEYGQAAALGIEDAKSEATLVRLNDLNVSRCRTCGNGWGTCRNDGTCQVTDDFQRLHRQIGKADGLVVVHRFTGEI